MRKGVVAGIVGVGLLAGCATLGTNSNYLYKDTPTTRSEKADDVLTCKVSAANEVPVSNQSSTTPTWTTPVITSPVSCYTSGGYTNCTGGVTTGGQTMGGNLVTMDVNRELRSRVEDRCLANKGYIRTSFPIPTCSAEQVPAGFVSNNSILYEPTEGSCVVNGTAGNGSVVLRPQDQLVPNRE